jgi:hypothetical protein
VKSRVSRGRERLVQLIREAPEPRAASEARPLPRRRSATGLAV